MLDVDLDSSECPESTADMKPVFHEQPTHLCRNVFRGPELRVQPLVWCELAREAEVGELERAGLAHEEVLCYEWGGGRGVRRDRVNTS